MSGGTVIVETREGAHTAIMNGYIAAKQMIADGRRVRITVEADSDPLTLLQRKFLHGPVLTQIAEQVNVEGARYVTAVWKEYLRALFLGSEFKIVFGKVVEVRNSTEALNVRLYSEYIDRVIAHAVTEWSVAFQFRPGERDAVRYKEREHAEA
jgi:hypothetical protein